MTTEPGSLARGLLGETVHTTSLHRQAVVEPGSGWRPTAWTGDGVIEAIEWRDEDWPALGVQWHPEHGVDSTGPALFGWLRDAAARVRV